MTRNILSLVLGWIAAIGLSTPSVAEDRLPAGAVGRFGSTAFRAQAWSTATALSRDGKTLAIGGEIITLTDLATGKTIGRFEESEPTHLAFLENDRTLASVSPKGTVRYWSLEKNGEARPAWQAFAPEDDEEPIAATSLNGELVLVASEGSFQVWDLGRQVRLYRFPIPDPTHSHSCALAPDGKTVAIVSRGEGRIVTWDARTGKPLARSDFELSDYYFRIGFSPDGKQIALAGGYGSYRVCDAATLRQTHYLRQVDKGSRLVVFSPDGRLLATKMGDEYLTLWDLETGQIAVKVSLVVDGRWSYFPSLFFSPDGKRMIAAEEEGPLTRIWDATTGRNLTDETRPQRAAQTIRTSADGKTMIAKTERTAFVWDSTTYRLRFQVPLQWGIIPAFSRSSDKIVYAHRDQSVRVVDAASGKELMRLPGNGREIAAVAFAANDAKIVTLEKDQTLRAWDAVTGKEIQINLPGIAEIFGNTDRSGRVAYSPDGQLSAVRQETGEGVDLRDLTTRKIVHTISTAKYPHGMAFVGNTQLAIGMSDTTILLWDVSRAKKGPVGPKKLEAELPSVGSLK